MILQKRLKMLLAVNRSDEIQFLHHALGTHITTSMQSNSIDKNQGLSMERHCKN